MVRLAAEVRRGLKRLTLGALVDFRFVRLAAEVRRGLKLRMPARADLVDCVRLAAEVRRGLKRLFLSTVLPPRAFASLLK